MTQQRFNLTLLPLLMCTMISACGDRSAEQHDDSTTQEASQASPSANASIYTMAVENPARPEADRERDADRRPAAVMEFLGIKPGMTVLDMYTGGGYYAELLSHVVGADGRIIAQSNQAYLGFVGDAFAQRFDSGRLKNAEVLMAENNELSLQENTLDAVMLVLSYHDVYHVDADNGWPKIDKQAFLAELKKGLKPDGLVAIIDHHAAAGSPSETGTTTHRIDPAIVVADLEAAGFVLDAESELLRNPDDDLSKIVFAPELRGKTDRFLMRFRIASQE